MKHLLIILVILLFTNCTVQKLDTYNKQMIDEGWIPFDYNIEWIEDQVVQHWCEALGKDLDEVECRYYDCVTITKENIFGKSAQVRCKKISYIPVTYADMNKRDAKGRIILPNRVRISRIPYIDKK